VPPERAGWTYTGLDVLRLQAGETRVIDVRARELLVLPLSGECVVQIADRRFDLTGRRSVFDGVSDFVFAGAGSRVELSSRTGGEIALPWARATQTFPPGYHAANDVPIEVRGAGRASRHIHNLFTHDVGNAERLVVVEVLTPPGNWSSWPPHKHDDSSSGEEDELEEIYYFRIAGADGFGLHRTYTLDGELDETVTVRDGDVFLVPRGYHGPCIAAPEFAMYYLNVLAGPGTTRTLRFSDDPAYAWIRESWRSR
jgi:5-deoxy-glucuronate isomerase